MTHDDVDQLAAVKASLELMVSETREIHSYFRDLLERMSALEDQPDEERRAGFRNMVEMGAFRFNGVDVRHFIQSDRKPLSPPAYLERTRRRLKNTMLLLNAFLEKGGLSEGEDLREQIEALSYAIVDETDAQQVRDFRDRVEALRGSEAFHAYLEARRSFITTDADVRTDAEFVSAKEQVEDGEESLRHREEELSALGERLDSGELGLDDAQAQLDELSLENDAD